MLIFFDLLGFLFISSSALLFNYVDNLFKPNKFTDLLSTNNNSIWENIKVTILPIILWTFIELPSMPTNENILIAKTLQLFVTLALTYAIYYTSKIVLDKDSKLAKTLAIIFASLFGSFVSYMCLSIKPLLNISLLYTIIGLGFFILMYCVLTYIPPKIKIFKDPDAETYGKN